MKLANLTVDVIDDKPQSLRSCLSHKVAGQSRGWVSDAIKSSVGLISVLMCVEEMTVNHMSVTWINPTETR